MQRRLFALSLLAGGASLTAGCGGGGEDGGGPGPAPSPAPSPAPAPDGGEDSATGTFAYVARPDTRDVAIHQVLASGALRRVGTAPAGLGVRKVAVHASGRFAYAINSNGRNISIYERDATTGLLNLKQSFGVPMFNPLAHFRFHPSGAMAYVGDDSALQAISINTDTGGLRLEDLTDDTIPIESFDVHPDGGRVFTVPHFGRVISWRVVADSLEEINYEDTQGVPSEVVVSPAGRFLYVTSHTDGINVHRVDLPDGLVGAPIQTQATRVLGPIVIHPSGRFAYASGLEAVDDETDRDGIYVLQIHPETGLLSSPTFVPTGPVVIQSLAISASRRMLYTANGEAGTVSAFAVDDTTGALNSAGSPIDMGGPVAGITLFDSTE